jgi:hypothetical protein
MGGKYIMGTRNSTTTGVGAPTVPTSLNNPPMTKSSARTTTHQCIRCTGKTTFLTFILAWLISVNQVVLLCRSTELFLFFGGKVYLQWGHHLSCLPVNLQGWLIWTLVDVDSAEGGPPLSGHHDVWPIQASSPNSEQWRRWVKQFNAGMLGMPLWNMEELMKGYVISCFLPRRGVWQGWFISDRSRPLLQSTP